MTNPTPERSVEEIVEELLKEAINDFDMAKASAGREVSFSYWFRDELTQTLQTERQKREQELQKAREERTDKLYGEGYYNGVMYERERIEAIFKEHVPPHAMDLEDSVWLKRLLNKAFNHDKNI